MSKLTETAPKRIWLQISDELNDEDEPFPESTEDVTWCKDSVLTCEVEYVRADLCGTSEIVPEITVPGSCCWFL